jgi:hypothetical protein
MFPELLAHYIDQLHENQNQLERYKDTVFSATKQNWELARIIDNFYELKTI